MSSSQGEARIREMKTRRCVSKTEREGRETWAGLSGEKGETTRHYRDKANPGRHQARGWRQENEQRDKRGMRDGARGEGRVRENEGEVVSTRGGRLGDARCGQQFRVSMREQKKMKVNTHRYY